MSKGHKKRRGCMGFGVVVLAMILGFVLFARSNAFLELVRGIAVEQTNAAIDGELAVERLEGSLWGNLKVTGATLKDARGNVMVRIESADVELELAPLVTSRLVVTRVSVDGVDVSVVLDEAGDVNFATLVIPDDSPEEPSSPIDFVIDVRHAEVAGVNVAFADRSREAGQEWVDAPQDALEQVDLSYALTKIGSGAAAQDVSFSGAGSIALSGPILVELDTLEAQVAVSHLMRDHVEIAKGAFILEENGSLRTSFGSVKVGTLADIKNIAFEMDEAGQMTASTGLSAHHQPLTELLESLQIPMTTIADVDAEISARLTDDDLEFELKSAVVDAGSLSAAGSLTQFSSDSPGFSIAAWGDGLQAHKWLADIPVESNANVTIVATGTGLDPLTMDVSGRLGAEHSRVDVYTLHGAVLEFNKTGTQIQVTKLAVDTPYAQVQGGGTLHDANFEAWMAARSGEELPNQLAQLMKSVRVEADLKTSGRIDFTADSAMAAVPEFEIDARWDLEDFHAEDVNVGESRGRLVANGLAGERNLDVQWDLDASGSELALGSNRVRDFTIDTQGIARIDSALPTDVLDLVTAADLGARVKVVGLRTAPVSVSRANVDARIKRQSGRRLSTRLKGSVSKFTHPSSKTLLGHVSGDLEGIFTLDRAYKPTQIEFSTTLNGEDIDAAGVTLKTATVAMEAKGPTDNLKGSAAIVATELPLSPYNFSTVNATVDLKGDRAFTVAVAGKQTEKSPENVNLELAGTFDPGLQGWNIDNVKVKTLGDAWEISKGLKSDADGSLEFDDVTLKHGGQEIRVDGSFEPNRKQEVTVKVSDFEIETVGREFGIDSLADVSGKASGDLSMSGTADAPEIEFNLTVKNLFVSGVGPFDIHIVGTYADEWLSLQTLDVSTDGARVLEGSGLLPCKITTRGEFKLYSERDVTADIETESLDLKQLHRALPVLAEYQVAGRLDGEFIFHGTLADPHLDMDFALVDLEAVIPGDPHDSKLSGISAKAKLNYAPPSQDGSGGFALETSLSDRFEQTTEIRASSTGALADWIRRVQRGESWLDLAEEVSRSSFRLYMIIPDYDISKSTIAALNNANVAGRLELFATASGTLANPQGQANLKFKGLGWDRFRDIEINAKVDVGGQSISLTKMEVNWDNDLVLDAKATVPLPLQHILKGISLSDLPLQAQVRIPQLPIAKLSAVDYTFARITGKMQAEILVEGSLSRPHFDLDIAIEDLLMADRTQANLEIRADAKAGQFTAFASTSPKGGKGAKFTATMPLNVDLTTLGQADRAWVPNGEISGSLKAKDVNVGALIPARALDEIVNKVKGRLNADIVFGGTVEAPDTNGTLSLSEFEAHLPTMGRDLSDGAVHLKFDKGGLNINEFFVGEGTGYLDVKGRLDGSFLSPKRIDLDIAVKELGTSGITPMPTYVTANSKVTADLGAVDRILTLDVRDLEVVIPDVGKQGAATALHDDIRVLTPQESELKLVTRKGIASFRNESKSLTRLNIKIAPGWIRHPNARIEFKGDLSIDAGAESRILGTIEALQGDVETLGKNFKIVSGLLTFRGDSPPNPRLQLEAEYLYSRNVAEALGAASSGLPRATILVTGTALDPKLKMYSDPSLEESEIVYVLVTDRAPETATSGEEDGVSSQAMAAATGLLSGMLKSRADQIYPVDMIRLDSDDKGISGVEVGKYFGADLFFAYEVQFAAEEDENRNSMRVEYQFAPRWLVGTRFGDRGNGSVFLFWKVL